MCLDISVSSVTAAFDKGLTEHCGVVIINLPLEES